MTGDVQTALLWRAGVLVDASNWFGPGSWLLDVQGHGENVFEELQPDGTLLKLESGQLMLMTIPGS
jgi:hypothetical protein